MAIGIDGRRSREEALEVIAAGRCLHEERSGAGI